MKNNTPSEMTQNPDPLTAARDRACEELDAALSNPDLTEQVFLKVLQARRPSVFNDLISTIPIHVAIKRYPDDFAWTDLGLIELATIPRMSEVIDHEAHGYVVVAVRHGSRNAKPAVSVYAVWGGPIPECVEATVNENSLTLAASANR